MSNLPVLHIQPKTHLDLPENMTFEEWEEYGPALARIHGGVMWWVGDWINYGERAYGEKYAQALEATDWSYDTLRSAAWVASRFETVRRLHNLSWSHHQTVASMDPDDADALLQKAEKEEWTVKALREAAKERRRIVSGGVVANGKRTTGGQWKSHDGDEPLGEVIRKAVDAGLSRTDMINDLGLTQSAARDGRLIVALVDDEALSDTDRALVLKAEETMNTDGHTGNAFPMVERLVEARFGSGAERIGFRADRAAKARMEDFMRGYGALVHACRASEAIPVPLLSQDQISSFVGELDEAVGYLRKFRARIKEMQQ